MWRTAEHKRDHFNLCKVELRNDNARINFDIRVRDGLEVDRIIGGAARSALGEERNQIAEHMRRRIAGIRVEKDLMEGLDRVDQADIALGHLEITTNRQNGPPPLGLTDELSECSSAKTMRSLRPKSRRRKPTRKEE